MIIANLQMTDRKIEESRTGIEDQALTNFYVPRTIHHGRNEAKFRSLDPFSDSFHRMIDSIIQNDAQFVMSKLGLQQGRGEKSVATARA